MLAVLVGDVITGSNLHLSAAFGYSPTGNSRLYGISNYSFGQLSAAACLLAGVHRAPPWPTAGAGSPPSGLMVGVAGRARRPDLGLRRRRHHRLHARRSSCSPRCSAGCGRASARARSPGLATVGAVIAFGFVDLARPAAERAHLGRLFERIGNEGLRAALSIVERKLLANLRVSTSSFWVAADPDRASVPGLFLSRGGRRPPAGRPARADPDAARRAGRGRRRRRARQPRQRLGRHRRRRAGLVVTATLVYLALCARAPRSRREPTRRGSWVAPPAVLVALLGRARASIGFDAWPLTGLAAVQPRPATTARPCGRSTPSTAARPRASTSRSSRSRYRNAAWPLDRAARRAPTARRTEVCEALLGGVRDAVPDADRLRIVRDRQRIVDATTARSRSHDASDPRVRRPGARLRLRRCVDDALWGPETGPAAACSCTPALARAHRAARRARPVPRSWPRLPDALFDPVPVLGFLDSMPSAVR